MYSSTSHTTNRRSINFRAIKQKTTQALKQFRVRITCLYRTKMILSQQTNLRRSCIHSLAGSPESIQHKLNIKQVTHSYLWSKIACVQYFHTDCSLSYSTKRRTTLFRISEIVIEIFFFSESLHVPFLDIPNEITRFLEIISIQPRLSKTRKSVEL